jgi:phage antirepressor YoqD-like protein
MITEFKQASYGKIRGTIVNGMPYVCLTDLSKMMGVTNSQKCRTTIPEADVLIIEDDTTKSKRKLLFIKAEHVSTCIFKSTKEEAELIGEWIYKQVLPNLLNISDEVDRFKDPYSVIEFLQEFHHLKLRNTVLETEQKINKPKLKYINKLLGSNQCIDLEMVTQIIKYPGLKPSELFKMLRAFSVIDDNNIPYQEYCDKKYFRVVSTTTKSNGQILTLERAYVYKSGIAFIERLLKEYEVKHDTR